jgi:thymidine phosphorylase
MSTHDAAQALADSLVEVAVGAGLPTSALLTDMNQPLASVAGNALEVRYAIDDLTNARIEPRMREVVVALGAEMLVVAGIAADVAAGRSAIEAAYADGRAAAKFAEMVTALGGPADLVEHAERHLAAAEVVVAVDVPAGTVQAIDTRAVGLAVVTLGGGRTRPQDPIDPAVGLVDLAEVGEAVGPDRPLAIVHARTEDAAAAAAEQVRGAYDVI